MMLSPFRGFCTTMSGIPRARITFLMPIGPAMWCSIHNSLLFSKDTLKCVPCTARHWAVMCPLSILPCPLTPSPLTSGLLRLRLHGWSFLIMLSGRTLHSILSGLATVSVLVLLLLLRLRVGLSLKSVSTGAGLLVPRPSRIRTYVFLYAPVLVRFSSLAGCSLGLMPELLRRTILFFVAAYGFLLANFGPPWKIVYGLLVIRGFATVRCYYGTLLLSLQRTVSSYPSFISRPPGGVLSIFLLLPVPTLRALGLCVLGVLAL